MYMYEHGKAQGENRGLPSNFAERNPYIEVSLRCPRCEGDFYHFENRKGDSIGAHGIGSAKSCRACIHGAVGAIVPLAEALEALGFKRQGE